MNGSYGRILELKEELRSLTNRVAQAEKELAVAKETLASHGEQLNRLLGVR